LGSVNLTKFVVNPFGDKPRFNFDAYADVVKTGVRMLDNVLDASFWPLEQQRIEAANKRRIGLGFLGLGDALVMMKIKYNSPEGIELARKISEIQRNSAYLASVELAKEKGAFPLFDADKYLAAPSFASRLPEDIKRKIRKHGIRHSHLISIAPTGTIALGFADNASNGIEPAFDWWYYRNRRMNDGTTEKLKVEDHAYRLYKHIYGETEVENLPDYFVSAQAMSAMDHLYMVEAVLPYVDSAISKTINVPADYPYEEFKDIYLEAHKRGLKGITTYRPNKTSGAVLETAASQKAAEIPNDVALPSMVDRRIQLDSVPNPVLSSLLWPGRPNLPKGSEGWVSGMIEHPLGDFAVFVSHLNDGNKKPFETWVMGAEQPRCLGAVAKTLSMDMRVNDKNWLNAKLAVLEKSSGDDGFKMSNPPDGEIIHVKSLVAGFAKLVRYRCEELGALTPEKDEPSPVMDALMTLKEPKSGTDGTMSWTVDILNAATNDDFVLGVKELIMPNGQRRPYSIWLSGEYPKALDGLCKILSLDMRVMDLAWVGMKLRKLLNFAEPRGDFMAKEPGSEKSRNYPSTVAYIARLIIHRYAMLGLLTNDGDPVETLGILTQQANASVVYSTRVIAGKKCEECNQHAVIAKDGCDYCTECGHTGSCG